jgi:hypothetical protein
MRPPIIICSILLAGALYSGATSIVSQIRLCAEWGRTPEADREALILGVYAPAVQKVRAQVPEEEGILLVSDMDPAPLPYALFPRKIWQMQTEPETSAVFMDLPPSPYPMRPPESFPVSWRLDLREANSEAGGELTRLKTPGGDR